MERVAFTVDGVTSASLRALNYSPQAERIRRAPKRKSIPISELLSEVGPAYGTVFIRKDCDTGFGIELLSQSDTFASEPQGRVIRLDSLARPERHEVRRSQVLIAGAGTLGENELYGRALIADARLVGKHVGPDSMAITFTDPGSNESLFAYAYLASPTGLAAIRATSYGTKLLRFREDLFRTLPVPVPDGPTLAGVAERVRRCIESREIYARELHIARQVFEELPEVRDALAECSAQGPRKIVWAGALPTLRAWNFASTGRALADLRTRWRCTLADALHEGGMFKGGRLTRVPCAAPHGVDLFSQRDVFSIRPVARRIQRPIGEGLEVDESMLLLASRGQVNEGALFGRVERAAHVPPSAVVTEDITRLKPLPGFAEGLYAFLSTVVGASLLRSTAYGTSIPGMRMDLLSALPVPDAEVLRRASASVAKATLARQAAIAAENEAIRIVEAEVLPSWLG